ncbi:hypothetical protein MTR67_024060 [Solanum verrucosum]|uniref:Uncharacterized protein n=1 Tax=Solanum verrucosum TaxID=315347 RepID=A0AAF0R0Z2_SOLVR|nr:hypothetical protein MTR67_024060 [Solanum verrucosum]
MLSQVMTNQVGQQRGNQHEVADTLRLRELLRMNPPSFTGSSTTRIQRTLLRSCKRCLRSCMLLILKGGTNCIPNEGCH